MKIPQNKDLNADFKNEIFRGFGWRDLGFGAVCLAIIGITAFTCGYYFSVPPQLCILIGIIPAVPVFILGFHRIQDMTVLEYFKEYLYDKQTEELTYDADELPENKNVWTMKKENGKEVGLCFFKRK